MSPLKPEPSEARRQFEEEVFPTELDYIEERRQSVDDCDVRPVNRKEIGVNNDLVGVALSGGGIRSASFSLGFLQALGSRMFRRIDYLSTVSGGGFIGSSISALMASSFYRSKPAVKSTHDDPNDSEVKDNGENHEENTLRGKVGSADFPFALTHHDEEPQALSHLRNNSKYMTPSGPRDLLPFLAVLIRGIILNSLSLFPFLLLTCLAVLLVYGQQLSDRAQFEDQIYRVDALLERYLGDRLDVNREIEPLLMILENEALLRIDEGKTRSDVINQLRPAFSFGRGTESDLIIGSGTEESPFRLTPVASREDLARVLLEGDLLQPSEIIEEVDLLARMLEQDGYRHCQETIAEEGACDADDVEYDDVEDLLKYAHQRGIIRHGIDFDTLEEFLSRRWSPRLKPVLQTLYNGEFLDAEILRVLVYEELDRRSPYYAYGWYKARVGDSFESNKTEERGADNWYSSVGDLLWEEEIGDLEETIDFELTQLATPFEQQCLTGSSDALQTCMRPKTSPGDVHQLLAFEEIIVPDQSLSNQPFLKNWAELQDILNRLREPDSISDVLEVLYFGEYLDEQWVQETLRETATYSEWQRLVSRLQNYKDSYDYFVDDDDEYELLNRLLVLKKETVYADVVEVLLEKKLITAPGSSDFFTELSEEDPSRVFEAVWDLLDQRWVHRMLYVYNYGWHRSYLGKPYSGAWCESVVAGRDVDSCPAVSDEAWGDLFRALKDPSRWDPIRLQLPLSWVATRVALGWVLLFPALLFAARYIYRRRQGRIAREPNPLRTLLSSDQSLNWRGLYEKTFGILLTVIFLVASFEVLPYAVHHFHYLNVQGQTSWTLAVGVVSFLITALSGPALAVLERFGRTVALVMLAVAGPILLLTVFVFTMEYVVYSPLPQVDTLLGFLAEPSLAFDPIANDLTDPVLNKVGQGTTLWFQEGGRRLLDLVAAWSLFAITVLLSFGLALLIDINATSLHGFYRDRISKAFMIGIDTKGDIEPEEDLALQHICPSGSGAPYHLLNVALNLQGCADRSLRGRNSDFLFFSRDYIGGLRTGFCRTRDMAYVFPQVHLGTAAAVSGAAVSPNMGRFKSGPVAILMSLLNMRLALWIPNPSAIRKWFANREDPTPQQRSFKIRLLDSWHRFRLRAPATLLLRELVGGIHDRGSLINVSDGGHIENTGALELLRRRCREVIIVDGEADPDMTFGGLALLQRVARIDMGIEIEIDLSALRMDENGLSRKRTAVGTIQYPARKGRAGGQDCVEETGKLLYIKLAVTGEEGETITEYRARNKKFPHQSTADQTFDEGQFEAYRRLGQLAGREIFEAEVDICNPHSASRMGR